MGPYAHLAPNNVFAGKTYQIVINGIGTHFRQGATRANFGPGIIVNSITVNDELTATAQVTIDSTYVWKSRCNGSHEIARGG